MKRETKQEFIKRLTTTWRTEDAKTVNECKDKTLVGNVLWTWWEVTIYNPLFPDGMSKRRIICRAELLRIDKTWRHTWRREAEGFNDYTCPQRFLERVRPSDFTNKCWREEWLRERERRTGRKIYLPG